MATVAPGTTRCIRTRRIVLVGSALFAGALTVAGCTGSSGGDSAPAPTATVTTTATPATTTASASATTGAPASTSTAAATSSTTSGGSSGGGGSASGTGLCTPTVMTFRVGQTKGAAGTSYTPVIATNASRQPCRTDGYPGVAALDASGRQIAQAQRTDGGLAGARFVVQPGQQISADLSGATMAPGVAQCPTSAAILVTLPDNTDSTRIALQIPACTNGVQIGPLVSGTTGR